MFLKKIFILSFIYFLMYFVLHIANIYKGEVDTAAKISKQLNKNEKKRKKNKTFKCIFQ